MNNSPIVYEIVDNSLFFIIGVVEQPLLFIFNIRLRSFNTDLRITNYELRIKN